jgi:SpoIID/LytB domain protein
MAKEAPRTTEAVQSTRGLTLWCDGALIDAVYSTNSGGITANAGDVWNADAKISYLESVNDFPANSPLSALVKPHMTEDDWRAYCTTPYDCYAKPTAWARTQLASRRADSPRARALYGQEDWPEFFRWQRTVTALQANAAFASRGIAQITAIAVEKRTDSGHIRRLAVQGFAASAGLLSAGGTPPATQPQVTVHLDGDGAIRSMFSRQLGSTTALPSSTFVVTPQTDDAGRLTGWLFQGAGWGHGVGLCQRGAQSHALQGWDAARILKWYYRGVEIKPYLYKS